MDNTWIAVAQLESSVDSDALSFLLNQQGIEHQFIEKGALFVLMIKEQGKRTATLAILRSVVQRKNNNTRLASPSSLQQLIKENPVVLASLLLSIVGALLVSFKFEWVHWFTYQDFRVVGDRIFFTSIQQGFEQKEYWRLLTPAFLHFGLFHVVFNALWLWEFGRRIETLSGSIHLLGIMLVSALISNIAQYQMEGPSLFGGMSGVVYGLLGYIWIRNRLAPDPVLAVAPGLIALMIGWLLICMTGLIDLFISGGVANAAHVGGLLVGMALGLLFGKINSNKTVL